MAPLSSLLLSLTSLPPLSLSLCFSHLLLSFFFFFFFFFFMGTLCPSLFWASLQFTWWADGQQANTGPGPRQARRTQSSRAEQRGCYITFRMIPLQRLLTVPHQQRRLSERGDSCSKNGRPKNNKRLQDGADEQGNNTSTEAVFTWIQGVLMAHDRQLCLRCDLWPVTCAFNSKSLSLSLNTVMS